MGIFLNCVNYVTTLTTTQVTEFFLKRRHIYELEKKRVEASIADRDYFLNRIYDVARRDDRNV